MPSQAAHRKHAEQNRERILDVASRLMSEQGFAATTISAVCKQADVVAPTVYWHFGDKQGLAVAVMERAAERWFEEFIPNDSLGPEARPDALSSLFRNRPEFLRLMLLLALERRDPDDAVRAAAEGIRQRARESSRAVFGDQLAGIDDIEQRRAAAKLLADFALAQTDGIFIASQLDSQRAGSIEELIDLMHVAIRAVARVLVVRSRSTS